MKETIRLLLDAQPSSKTLFQLAWFGYVFGLGSIFIPIFSAVGIVGAISGDPSGLLFPVFVLVILCVQGVIFGAAVVWGLWILRQIAARTIAQQHWL